MKPYHRIWIDNFGPIPKDANGRSMEIHHRDGDNTNNSLDNLQLVTIDEHFKIHYDQKDWAECYFMTLRMNKTPEEISKESSELQRRLVAEGRHHLQGGEIQGRASRKRVKEGTHNLMTREDGSSMSRDRVNDGSHQFLKREDGSSISSDRVKNGTHNLLGSEMNRKRIEEGSHQLLGPSVNLKRLAEGTHPSQKLWICEHCGKSGRGQGNYIRHHGDRCKQKK